METVRLMAWQNQGYILFLYNNKDKIIIELLLLHLNIRFFLSVIKYIYKTINVIVFIQLFYYAVL